MITHKIKKEDYILCDIYRLIYKGDIVIIESFFEKELIANIKKYLTNIINSSIPNYEKLNIGCKNFYRLNCNDQRSIVKTYSAQFNFFPWNNDPLDLFNKFNILFKIRDLTIKKDSAFQEPIDNEIIKRISIQFYPSGAGFMQPHSDPIGEHQFGVVNVVLSQHKIDYQTGGLFFQSNVNERKIYPEYDCNIGDIIIFNGSLIHGVDLVDQDVPLNIFSGRGRWMLMSAITKSHFNERIPNAKTY